MWNYELFEVGSDAWGWRLRGDDGAVVMGSEATYPSRLSARRALVKARVHAGDARLPSADGLDDVLGEVLERIARRDEEEAARRTTIAALN